MWGTLWKGITRAAGGPLFGYNCTQVFYYALTPPPWVLPFPRAEPLHQAAVPVHRLPYAIDFSLRGR